MMVIAIIGILAAIAVPQYGHYSDKAKFSEIQTMTSKWKLAVSLCHQQTSSFDTCNGTNLATDDQGVPADLVSPGLGYAESVSTNQGVILVTATAEIDNLTYQLTPSYTPGSGLDWTVGGTCLAARLCNGQ